VDRRIPHSLPTIGRSTGNYRWTFFPSEVFFESLFVVDTVGRQKMPTESSTGLSFKMKSKKNKNQGWRRQLWSKQALSRGLELVCTVLVQAEELF
jgi:hypothetical protein